MQIFLHIPKTAGTTLNYVLQRQYSKPGAIYTLGSPEPEQGVRELNKLPPDQRSAVQLLRGHCAFGAHRFLTEPSSYFTVLRNPIDRVVSHYYYVLRTPTHEDHARLIEKKYTLVQYIQSGEVSMFDNGQTGMLAGRAGVDFRADFAKCGAAALELAESNLAQYFDVAGLQEEFDSTLLILQKAYNWKPPYYVAQNVTDKRPMVDELSAETLDVIRAYNQIDIQLYDRAAARFRDRIAQLGPEFAEELKQFRAANYRYGQVRLLVRQFRSRARRTLTRFSAARA